ncbi:MAG: restriction endonuclease subunit S, partial [Acidobacteriaceae bacterium]
IDAQASGTTRKRITGNKLKALSVRVPPTNEQRRIVEKIETLFAQLDQGEAALREVSRLLARYRQSMLKAAITGRLTADWRAENAHRLEHGRDALARILQTRRDSWQGRGKFQEPVGPDTTDLPELPEGWVWASVQQLAEVIGGLTKNSKRQDLPLRKPMVRVANVYQNRLELSDIHKVGVTDVECARTLLEDRDLLVVEGNGSKDQIGRMAVWRNEIPEAVHQNHLIKVRMVEKGLVEFALWWFQSPTGRQKIEKVASSTSGLYTLSISKIEALVVPLPGLPEVLQINELVDEAFSKITLLETWCAAELTRSAALRQSILKDAFAGRLVPQDPNDEPAAALLARIRAAREGAPKKTARKKAKA